VERIAMNEDTLGEGK